VLHVGSFAKLIAPGLRIGWIAAHQSHIARLLQLKSDGGSNPLIQRIVLEFCRSPDFAAHVQRVQGLYREHRDRMVAAVRRDLPQVKMQVPRGGYYLWLELPAHVDGDQVAQCAAALGVNIIPGSRFFARDPRRGTTCNYIRLSYSFATLEQIDAGVRRLADVVREQIAA
jgi:2-aminoadipate transaminase